MRCPQCNKFVSYDTDVEPEEESQDVEGTTFTGSYRRVLQCGDCGEDLKELTIEVEHDFSGDVVETEASKEEADKVDEKSADKASKPHEHEFEIESCAVSATTGSVTKDRHGRPITRARYMATLYGVECAVEVKCECGATAEFTAEASERASSFDELT